MRIRRRDILFMIAGIALGLAVWGLATGLYISGVSMVVAVGALVWVAMGTDLPGASTPVWLMPPSVYPENTEPAEEEFQPIWKEHP